MMEYEERARKIVKSFLLYLGIPEAIIVTGIVITSRLVAEAYPTLVGFGWACVMIGTMLFVIISNVIFTQMIVIDAVKEIKGDNDGNPTP